MTETSPLIVVGVDGSACAQDALRWAHRYAEAMGGRIVAVTAWHYPPTPAGPGIVPPTDYNPQDTARQVLAEAVATEGLDSTSVDQVVVEGNPAGVLIDRSEQADLLVVGTRGHGGFTGMLLGSVSAHCVHHAHCPVVVVRS